MLWHNMCRDSSPSQYITASSLSLTGLHYQAQVLCAIPAARSTGESGTRRQRGLWLGSCHQLSEESQPKGTKKSIFSNFSLNGGRSVCLSLSQMQSEAVYAVEVLLCCSSESCKGAPKEPPKPPPPGDKGEMQVCSIIMYNIIIQVTS